jgi:hypothetical protein
MLKHLFLFLLFTVTASANNLNGKSFRFEYEDGNHYNVEFTEKAVSWKCIKGRELGRSETDPYLIQKITPKIFFIQWVEKDNTFVTLTLDTQSRYVYSSGVSGTSTWFQKGMVFNTN